MTKRPLILAASFVMLPCAVATALVIPLVDVSSLSSWPDRLAAISAAAAVVTAVATTTGICLLYSTLNYTRRMYEQAQKTTKAAIDANMIMRQEQRAWVKIERMEWKGVKESAESTLTLHIRNGGKSTAIVPRINFDQAFLEELVSNPMRRSSVQSTPERLPLALLPGECLPFRLKVTLEMLKENYRHKRYLPRLVVDTSFRTLGHPDTTNIRQCFSAEFWAGDREEDGQEMKVGGDLEEVLFLRRAG